MPVSVKITSTAEGIKWSINVPRENAVNGPQVQSLNLVIGADGIQMDGTTEATRTSVDAPKELDENGRGTTVGQGMISIECKKPERATISTSGESVFNEKEFQEKRTVVKRVVAGAEKRGEELVKRMVDFDANCTRTDSQIEKDEQRIELLEQDLQKHLREAATIQEEIASETQKVQTLQDGIKAKNQRLKELQTLTQNCYTKANKARRNAKKRVDVYRMQAREMAGSVLDIIGHGAGSDERDKKGSN